MKLKKYEDTKKSTIDFMVSIGMSEEEANEHLKDISGGEESIFGIAKETWDEFLLKELIIEEDEAAQRELSSTYRVFKVTHDKNSGLGWIILPEFCLE